jgi:hypothetical protein
MTKSRNILGPRTRWTPEMDQTVRTRYPNEKTADIAAAMGLSEAKVYCRASLLGVKKSDEFMSSVLSGRLTRAHEKGRTTYFQKGMVPWNKGMKGLIIGGEGTQFKAGMAPHTREIGSLKISKDGTLLQKVSNDKGNNSKRWRGVHELVWIAANGPLPPGHIVVFKPGCRTAVLEEITIDKVECISLVENMKRNTRHNLPKPLADLIAVRAALTRQINKRS